VGALDSPQTRRLFGSDTNVIYSAAAGSQSAKSGYLLFIQKRDLMAQPFNPSTQQVEGDAARFATDIGSVESLALAPVSVSDQAVLVYESISQPTRQLVWMDRTGKQLGKAAEPANWGPPRISADGKRVAVGKANDAPADPKHLQADLWILDEDGSATQLTSETGTISLSPVWSPDGSRIAFACCDPETVLDIYTMPARGQGRKELLYRSDESKNPTDWSRDGRYLLFGSARPRPDRPRYEGNVWAMSLSDKRAAMIVGTIFDENYATLSPDGRWLAYQSTESGQNQIYVQPFDGLSGGTKRRWQVFVGDGALPRWRDDGQELYFMTASGALMAATLHLTGDEPAFDPPHMLFQVTPLPNVYNLYDAAPDGQRSLLNLPMEWNSSSPITVLTSWTEKLGH
jgi:eukaryotic-like serine/threonine-protein kinase